MRVVVFGVRKYPHKYPQKEPATPGSLWNSYGQNPAPYPLEKVSLFLPRKNVIEGAVSGPWVCGDFTRPGAWLQNIRIRKGMRILRKTPVGPVFLGGRWLCPFADFCGELRKKSQARSCPQFSANLPQALRPVIVGFPQFPQFPQGVGFQFS
jgi:hypothetical protein